MSFCLPLDKAAKFIQALKNGDIDPGKLSQMSSEERRAYFEAIVGKDDAQEVNAQFESKLLLKNQQTGLINWAKNVAGISETVRRDIFARIEKMDTVLNPGDETGFLHDLVAKKLGTEVNVDEAKQIMQLSHAATDAKTLIPKDSPAGSPERLDYGAKQIALQGYLSDLKNANRSSSIIDDFRKNPAGAVKNAITKISGIAKSLKATLDDAAIFHQGWKTLFTDPRTWATHAAQSLGDMVKQIGHTATDNDILNGIKADVISRPNALDGTYQKMKLDVGLNEEEYPTTLPEKIPLLGRLYKASEVAYKGFLLRMRADIADKYVDIARNTGVDLTDRDEVRSIGRLVNSLTGRGDLGAFEQAGKTINSAFFSPKLLKSNFDFLTLHSTDDMSSFARKQAAVNLVKVIGGIATIMGIANTLKPGSATLDPRSSDFGKIRVGDTRFDITGSMGSLVTLAARLMTLSTVSSTSGKTESLTSGKFGAQNGMDVFNDFIDNKLSPTASVVKDYLKGQDFDGNRPTVAGEAENVVTPFVASNVQEMLQDPKHANIVLSTILDGLGLSAETYGKPAKKKD